MAVPAGAVLPDRMGTEQRALGGSMQQAAVAAVQMAVPVVVFRLETQLGETAGKIVAVVVRELAAVEQTVAMVAAVVQAEAVPVGIMEEMAASRPYGPRQVTVPLPDLALAAAGVARRPAAAIPVEHPLAMAPVARAAAQGSAIPPPRPVPRGLLSSAILLP